MSWSQSRSKTTRSWCSTYRPSDVKFVTPESTICQDQISLTNLDLLPHFHATVTIYGSSQDLDSVGSPAFAVGPLDENQSER